MKNQNKVLSKILHFHMKNKWKTNPTIRKKLDQNQNSDFKLDLR